MQRYEVEAIFEQKKDGLFEDINISSQKPSVNLKMIALGAVIKIGQG